MARVKVTFKNGKEIPKRLLTRVGRAIKKSKFEKELVEELVEEIRDEGIRPALKSSTISNRKRLATINKTHPSFRASKSNLTLTGELLNSLKAKFQVSKLSYLIAANKKKHKAYRTNVNNPAKKSKRRASNREILGFQSDLGRKLVNIFKRKRFKEKVAGLLKEAILKNFS